MNVVVSIYLNGAFKEYQLPSVNNADYSIILPKEHFDLKQNFSLDLEVLDHQWYIKKPKKESGGEQGGRYLNKDAVIQMIVEEKKMSIIVRYVSSIIHPYKKYQLDGKSSITIGKDTDNDISYPELFTAVP